MPSTFLKQKGNYRELIAFQKAECILDITYYFANKYLRRGDRTIDQMVQAARSGRQNIAEGCEAGTTSSESEIRLINVAKASLQELLLDYEDYLRLRGLHQWNLNEEIAIKTRRFCQNRNDSAFYREIITRRDDATICNLAITLIHQTDYLLRRYIEALQKDFLHHGGIKEQMYNARINHRNQNK